MPSIEGPQPRHRAPQATRDEDGSLHLVSSHIVPGDPLVILYFGRVEGRVECIRVEIGARFDSPTERDPRPLQSTDMRIPLRTYVDEALAERALVLDQMSAASAESVTKFLSDLAQEGGDEEVQESVRRDVRPHADLIAQWMRRRADEERPETLASRMTYDPYEVARVYMNAYETGVRAPTKAVAEHFTISRKAASKRVFKVRNELGLIPPTTQGKAAGTKTVPPMNTDKNGGKA